jgi:hypothetical protein
LEAITPISMEITKKAMIMAQSNPDIFICL